MRYAVRIFYTDGTVAYLGHRGRSSWCLRTARKHAADIRAGRTGITGWYAVLVEPAP